MSEKEVIIWGIHGGKTGDADTLFLRKHVVALGWNKIGDLEKLKPDREAFKNAVTEAFPGKKPKSIQNNAGQLFRFIHEMKIGDLVVYPSRRDHFVHIGKVEGPYIYDTEPEPGYPHLRPVKWLTELPRTIFSQGALYEIGSAMSFFQIKSYAEEFRDASLGKSEPLPVAQDESVAEVSEGIIDSTRDFILKRLAQELKGLPLEEFVEHLLNTMGYKTRLAPQGKLAGIDILAHKDELGFEPPIIKVQVKSGEDKSVSDPTVSALFGRVGSNEFGLVITLGSFTQKARDFEHSKNNLRLIDGNEFVDLILQHYEQFDSKYKGLLPLKRVYIPEAIEETNE